MAAGFFDYFRMVWGWKSSAPAVLATVSDRYRLVGTSEEKFSLTGATTEKLRLVGTQEDKFTLTGA